MKIPFINRMKDTTSTEENKAEDSNQEMQQENNDSTIKPETLTETEQIAELQAEVAEQKNNFLRLYAEFENYKKRSIKERIDLLKSASADVIQSMLPVLDDFERAFKALEGQDDTNPLHQGSILIYNKLKTLLEQKGLKQMEAIGTDFDTDMHDAITSLPVNDDQKGKVIEEVEKGYYLNDKILRHSKVIVGA